MAEISAQAVKALRERTGAGMMECKKALADAAGDVERAIELLRERGLAKAAKRAGRATSEGAIALATSEACRGHRRARLRDRLRREDRRLPGPRGSGREAPRSRIPGRSRPTSCSRRRQAARSRSQAASGKLGENMVLKRSARLAVAGAGRHGRLRARGRPARRDRGARDRGDGRRARPRSPRTWRCTSPPHDPSPVAIDRDGVPKPLLDKETEILRRQAEQEGKPPAVTERIVEGRLKKFYAEVCLLEQAFVKNPDQSVRAAARGGRQEARPAGARDGLRALQAGGGRHGMSLAYRRIVLKLSGEVLAGDQGFGIHPDVFQGIARADPRRCGDRHADRHRDRRRQHHPRHLGGLARHGSRHRRLHGHDGERHEQRRAPGRAREARPLHARAAPRSRSRRSPSPTSAAAPSGTSRRAAS